MYSALEISRYIINKGLSRNIRINNIRLQALLYLVQGIYCMRTSQRLIREDFVVGGLCPKVDKVYNHYCIYGSFELPEQIDFDLDDNLARRIIEYVLLKYNRVETWTLLDYTKNQDPYKYTRQLFGTNTLIPYESIKRYFENEFVLPY